MSLLETIMHNLDNCPICDASNSFKISGLIGKSLECTRCKAKWSAGTYDDGDRWLMLMNPSNTNVGVAKSGLMYRNFPVDLWVHKDKPVLKVDRYAAALYEYFGDFADFRDDIGHADFKDSDQGVWFIGPGLDVVAIIQIWWEQLKDDYNIRMVVLDQTPLMKEKNRDKTDLFLYMVTKKLYLFTEETGIPITPYLLTSWKEPGKEVEENWFYPFKELNERNVTAYGDLGLEIIQMYSQLKPKKRTKPTKPKPATAKPPKKATKKVAQAKYCTNCGSSLPQNALFCPNCGTKKA